MLFAFSKCITYAFVRLFFKMRYEGLENIPQEGGYILCSNHRSFLDPILLTHKEPHRMNFMAKEELFKNKFVGWAIRDLGAFPVARGKGDTAAIETATNVLRSGEVLLIFPEGTRSKDGRPLRVRSGVAVISRLAWANVLCCSIDFGKKLRFRTPITLRFHPVLTPSQMNLEGDSTDAIKSAARMVMDTIASGLKSLPEPPSL